MRQSIIVLLAISSFVSTFGQQIISGDYSSDLKLSYDSTTKIITGYFQSYTGLDQKNNNPRFSCIFYIAGKVSGQKINVKTYYPVDKKSDLIQGTMEIVTNKEVKIKLPEEHGGCWNVFHFADEPVDFKLEKKQKWIQIRYIDTGKAYFYGDKTESKLLKYYLIEGDFVCIEKIERQWAYGTFFGKKTIRGWLRLNDLNNL